MIKGVTLYHVICDGCGNTYPHNGVNEEVFFERKTALMTCIYAGWAKVDGKLYCPECHEHNVKAGKYKLINKKNRHGTEDRRNIRVQWRVVSVRGITRRKLQTL